MRIAILIGVLISFNTASADMCSEKSLEALEFKKNYLVGFYDELILRDYSKEHVSFLREVTNKKRLLSAEIEFLHKQIHKCNELKCCPGPADLRPEYCKEGNVKCNFYSSSLPPTYWKPD